MGFWENMLLSVHDPVNLSNSGLNPILNGTGISRWSQIQLSQTNLLGGVRDPHSLQHYQQG
eukprot:12932645-Prorocentrum_lima.AAC.1